MAQMNPSMKQKQTQGHRKQACDCQGEGGSGGKDWSLGLADANYYIQIGLAKRSYCIAQGAIFNILLYTSP